MQGQVEFFRTMHARHGDYVRFWLGTFTNYLISDPDAMHEVLVTKADKFHKDDITQDLVDMLGQGLLTSEDDLWRRQRKLAAPALKRSQIANYAQTMVSFTQRHVDTYEDGAVIDVHENMMHLTMEIVVKTLFNLDAGPELERVGEAIDTAMTYFHLMTHTPWRFVPEVIPMPARKAFEESMVEFDRIVYTLIDERRSSGEEGDDLLYRLLIANDDEGEQMSDVQLRDEVITMFLAGHETTALTLTYTWYLLSLHPQVADALYAEIDDVLKDGDPTVDDVGRLPYTTAVIKESMRMYPPAWIIGRKALEDVEIGGYTVEKGGQVLMAQCVTHMLEEYFEEPYVFTPERWLDPDFEKSLPRHIYFPFGGGVRICIGTHFAMMEAVLCLATMARKVRLKNRMTEPLRTQPAVTLRPVSPIRMKVERRDQS